MKIRFSVDLRELLDAEAKMALESRLPEFAAKQPVSRNSNRSFNIATF